MAARQDANAFPYLQRAAEKANQRSAHREAMHYLNAAIRIVRDEPPSMANNARELQLVLQTGVVQTMMSGYASPEVGQTFERALELSRGLDQSIGLFPALHGLYRFYYVRADVKRASELSKQLLTIASASGSDDLALEAHRAIANCRFVMGEFASADAHFKESLALYDEKRHADHHLRFGVDPFVGAASVCGLNTVMLGRAEEAFELGRRAIQVAETRDHPFSLCWALIYTSLVHQIENDIDGVGALSERLVELAERHRLTQWQIGGAIMRGWWLFASGKDRVGGLEMLATGVSGWQAIGALNSDAYFASLLAEAHLSRGDYETAAAITVRALETARSTGQMWWTPEVLRLHGEAIGMSGRSEDGDVVRSLIEEARALALQQGSLQLKRKLPA
jgi:tetratricopeptide (TPR) repeat protein